MLLSLVCHIGKYIFLQYVDFESICTIPVKILLERRVSHVPLKTSFKIQPMFSNSLFESLRAADIDLVIMNAPNGVYGAKAFYCPTH